MIDFCKYEIVKASRMKFRDLYFGNGSPESYRNAFRELWGHMDALLCQYECDIAEMEAWYDEQEKKIMLAYEEWFGDEPTELDEMLLESNQVYPVVLLEPWYDHLGIKRD